MNIQVVHKYDGIECRFFKIYNWKFTFDNGSIIKFKVSEKFDNIQS